MNWPRDILNYLSRYLRFREGIFDKRTLCLSATTLLALAIVGWLGFTIIQQEVKRNTGAQLQASLNANIEALKIWSEEEKRKVTIWANEESTRRAIVALEKKVSQGTLSADTLPSAPESDFLRQQLGSVVRTYDFVGYVVFDRSGLQISAGLDDPVGKRELIHRSDFVNRSLKGETVMSLPFVAEIPIPSPDGRLRQDWPTMFFSAPVRDDAGTIVAVLAFRHRPESSFSLVMEVSRTGTTGETYAFDANALMITDSRFNAQLRKEGRIPDSLDSHAILSIQLRTHKETATSQPSPLTHMAESALKGQSGMDLNGYPDYRNIPVVSAWTWLPEYGFGVATEMDTAEAFAPLVSLNHIFLTLLSLLVVSVIVSLILKSREHNLNSRSQRAEDALNRSIAYLDGLMGHFTDGVITINENGTILSFNPAAEKIFGYSCAEALGQNVTRMMPESYQNHHLKKFNDRINFTSENATPQILEIEGLKQDQSRFPMEISISEISMDEERLFVCIARDISTRKKIEQELHKNRIELELKVLRRTADLLETNRQLQQEVIEREKTQDRLRTSLKEKEILLREVHHRTKNNLQIISSLYGMALNHTRGDHYKNMLRENHNRILSIALVHDRIFRSNELTQVNSEEYIRSLGTALLHSFGYEESQIRLTVQTDGTPMGLDLGIYCGLILNELITNSLKHAFAKPSNGEISIHFRATDHNTLHLTVADNGIGLPSDFDIHNNPSLGLQLVISLVEEQLNGTLKFNREPGTEFQIDIPNGAQHEYFQA